MKRQTLITLAVVGAALSGQAAAWADLIKLKDGSEISGTMVRVGDAMLITQDSGAKRLVKPEDVVKVTLTSSVTPAEKAEAAWTRLQPELRKTEKFADAVALLEGFVKDHPDTPAGKNAQDILDGYRQMTDGKPVKFHGKWMPQAQVEVTRKTAEEKASPALEQYKAGKLREALQTAKDALKIDDENETALKVAGLAGFRLNQLLASRDYLLKLSITNPQSVLAWNNLGAVAYQLKREPEGVGYYLKAVQVAPDNRLVLDNVAEALHAYKGSKEQPAYRDLVRQYTQAEARMEAAMAKQGLYRYGSSWVTQAQRDRLAANKKAAQDAAEQLESQWAGAQKAAATIDKDIKNAQADMDQALNDYNYFSSVAANNATFYGSYDPYASSARDKALSDYVRAEKKKKQLEQQKVDLAEAVKKIRTDAPKVKAALAAADAETFTGVQRIIDIGDEDKVPGPSPVNVPVAAAPAAPATTAPATPTIVVTPTIETPVTPTDSPWITPGIGLPSPGWPSPWNPWNPVWVSPSPPVVVVPPTNSPSPIIVNPNPGVPVVVFPPSNPPTENPKPQPKPVRPPPFKARPSEPGTNPPVYVAPSTGAMLVRPGESPVVTAPGTVLVQPAPPASSAQPAMPVTPSTPGTTGGNAPGRAPSGTPYKARDVDAGAR